MKTRIAQAPVYILHRRSYQESSFLLECFSREHGRLSVLAKGARKSKMQISALLEPFVPLLLSWSGMRELKTMTDVEARRCAFRLEGDALFSGFYLNELIIKLTARFDAHPELFLVYEQTLEQLESGFDERMLRCFEKKCLQELGYGVFSSVVVFDPARYYQFVMEHGFAEVDAVEKHSPGVFSGDHLIQFFTEAWRDQEALSSAKRLMRLVFHHVLSGEVLKSRSLFVGLV